MGFPIVGDPTYGLYGEANPRGGLQDVPVSVEWTEDTADPHPNVQVFPCSQELQKAWTASHPPNEKPMCLHASLLEFQHPITKNMVTIRCPPEF